MYKNGRDLLASFQPNIMHSMAAASSVLQIQETVAEVHHNDSYEHNEQSQEKKHNEVVTTYFYLTSYISARLHS